MDTALHCLAFCVVWIALRFALDTDTAIQTECGLSGMVSVWNTLYAMCSGMYCPDILQSACAQTQTQTQTQTQSTLLLDSGVD